jgi:hypothetical protein
VEPPENLRRPGLPLSLLQETGQCTDWGQILESKYRAFDLSRPGCADDRHRAGMEFPQDHFFLCQIARTYQPLLQNLTGRSLYANKSFSAGRLLKIRGLRQQRLYVVSTKKRFSAVTQVNFAVNQGRNQTEGGALNLHSRSVFG